MNGEIQVTKHFKEKEFVVSDSFPDIAAHIELTPCDVKNLFHLVSPTLEPERVDSGKETYILQGKRSEKLYIALLKAGYNPSPDSKHHFKNPFDCAIDFQKRVYKMKGLIDVTRSRVATICAFFWIVNNCPYSFGMTYYQYPKTDKEIGFVHIQAITPGKPIGSHFIRE